MDLKSAGSLAAGVLLAASAPASAAMYRCGNLFQDRPCESLEQQQVIKQKAPQGVFVPGQRTTGPAAIAPTAQPISTGGCGTLQEQRGALQARLRGANRAETVVMLKRQVQEVEKNLGEAGCL